MTITGMQIDMISLFPEFCKAALSLSILGRAEAKGLFRTRCYQLRDYTKNKQKQTDDYPFGGGQGKVLYAQPIADCIREIRADAAKEGREKPYVIFMTPAGKPFQEADAKRLSAKAHLVLVCGHYEGFDQRVIDAFADEELSIGDYVLTGGELAALVVADSVLRLQPGVLRSAESFEDESHWDGLLEYPQYTQPAVWEGREVPAVLRSGNHKKIAAWREEQRHIRTKERRPELYEAYLLKKEKHADTDSD